MFGQIGDDKVCWHTASRDAFVGVGQRGSQAATWEPQSLHTAERVRNDEFDDTDWPDFGQRGRVSRTKRRKELDLITVYVLNDIDLCHCSRTITKQLQSNYNAIIMQLQSNLQIDLPPPVCVRFWSTMAQSKRLDEPHPMTIYAMNDTVFCHGSKSFGPNDDRLDQTISSKRLSFGQMDLPTRILVRF